MNNAQELKEAIRHEAETNKLDTTKDYKVRVYFDTANVDYKCEIEVCNHKKIHNAQAVLDLFFDINVLNGGSKFKALLVAQVCDTEHHVETEGEEDSYFNSIEELFKFMGNFKHSLVQQLTLEVLKNT